MQKVAQIGEYSDEVKSVLIDTAPVLYQMVLEYGSLDMMYTFFCPGKEPLTTKYVSILALLSITERD